MANEIANVARGKLAMPWRETDHVLETVRALCLTEPLPIETHGTGRRIAQRHGLSVHEAIIAAAALLDECQIL